MDGRGQSRAETFAKIQLALPSHEQAMRDGRERALALKNDLARKAAEANRESYRQSLEIDRDTPNWHYE